jgi:hypothetical protein
LKNIAPDSFTARSNSESASIGRFVKFRGGPIKSLARHGRAGKNLRRTAKLDVDGARTMPAAATTE